MDLTAFHDAVSQLRSEGKRPDALWLNPLDWITIVRFAPMLPYGPCVVGPDEPPYFFGLHVTAAPTVFRGSLYVGKAVGGNLDILAVIFTNGGPPVQ